MKITLASLQEARGQVHSEPAQRAMETVTMSLQTKRQPPRSDQQPLRTMRPGIMTMRYNRPMITSSHYLACVLALFLRLGTAFSAFSSLLASIHL